MRSHRSWAPALALVACVSTALPAFAIPVVNGDFEAGNLTGWTLSGDTSFIGVEAGVGRNGSFAAFFGPDPVGGISQVLATQAGTSYRVSFWLALDDSATPNAFSWSWNGVTQGGALSNGVAFDYILKGGNVTAYGRSIDAELQLRQPAVVLAAGRRHGHCGAGASAGALADGRAAVPGGVAAAQLSAALPRLQNKQGDIS